MWKNFCGKSRKKTFLRSKLAILKRKTKAYAKSIRALYRALDLVFVRWKLLSIC